MPTYKIRQRGRRGYSREAGGYDAWTEYQVVDGRRVLARFDMLHQAQAWIARQTSADNLQPHSGKPTL